ncbi:predicted protein [Botrytis cinerea T4]|uniref:Uncharacterized protein n=1 Tax=Botryotinia fuckeliana (strain T4) TaxID=999810 RepID=G2XY93_BOTF4|nr:predicted protein [Botrytis cinerea T4]
MPLMMRMIYPEKSSSLLVGDTVEGLCTSNDLKADGQEVTNSYENQHIIEPT